MMNAALPTSPVQTVPPEKELGCDELNLAEWPIFSFVHRKDDVAPFRFATGPLIYRRADIVGGKTVERVLTVYAPEAIGYPTAFDSDVLLGLVTLSARDKFAARTLSFTRYRLVELMDWDHSAGTYQRITESLRRWKAVTFDLRNAWYEAKTGRWLNRIQNFSVLDNVDVFERRDADGVVAPETETGRLPPAVIHWNESVFQNFKAQWTKSIDLSLYLSLRSPIARRMFRVLDKRFNRGKNPFWAFPLQAFAFEIVGLSRSYGDAGQIKRKLEGPIRELVEKGVLAPMQPKERFVRLRTGEWKIRFNMAGCLPLFPADNVADPTPNPLVTQLVERGVGLKIACELAAAHPAEQIEQAVAVFDWLKEGKDRRIGRNPAGYLRKSIEDGYGVPEGYVSPQERKELEAKRDRQQAAAKAAADADAKARKEKDEHDQRVRTYLHGLSEEARGRLQAEVDRRCAAKHPGLARRGESLAALVRVAEERAYVEELLAAEGDALAGSDTI
ncbi:MAG: replication initiator protein A [Planctomycetia bacterium]